MYDAIVVGAGGAGPSTALLLAGRGRRVLVVDRWRPAGAEAIDELGPEGTAMLARWGVLDRLPTGGAERRTLHLGSRSVPLDNLPFLGTTRSVTVGRAVLVERLLAAAGDAGAEVRRGFTVTNVVWAGGRAAGVVGHWGDDHSVFELGRIIVGADGHRSAVAGAVGARPSHQHPSTNCCYTATWSGLDSAEPEAFFLDREVVTVVPYVAARCQVTVWVPIGEWAEFKRRPEATYRQKIGRIPALAERMAGARRETRLSGTADLWAGSRQSAGAGWVLVGDAGHRCDPLAGRGIAEGFIQADLLAAAIDAGLPRRERLDAALTRFARTSEARAQAIQRITSEIGSYRWALPDIPGLLGALDSARHAGIDVLAA